MATPDRAGWFDDPENPEQLRYFDGILWTTNVTPRRTRWEAPAAPQAPSTTPVAPPVNPYAAPPATPGMPPMTRAGFSAGPTTDDGVPLASYGLRVAAYIIDGIIAGFLGMIAGGWFLWQAIAPVRAAFEAALASGDPEGINAAMTNLDLRALAIYSAIALVVTMAYQLFFLTRWSATPGKLLLNISVRRVSRPGVLDFGSASRRVAFMTLLSALGNMPYLSFVGLAGTVADLIWPLSDRRRQTLHDKVADTVVVVGRQSRR
ncbi:MAG: RDD family protein [Actinobacteria bacterium]|jgi:uncharacterized RDD family membrane protein YckC|nr:RDD family protein [Actinomycetota bacterium]